MTLPLFVFCLLCVLAIGGVAGIFSIANNLSGDSLSGFLSVCAVLLVGVLLLAAACSYIYTVAFG